MGYWVLSALLGLSSLAAEARPQNTVSVSLSREDNNRENIINMMAAARQEGAQKLEILPQSSTTLPILAADTREDLYPAGDLYFIEGGLTNSDTDENIRSTDYDAIKVAVTYASFYRFKVIIQLYGSSAELRDVVENSVRPTILIWSGHGDEDGNLYDSAGIAMPHDLFKNVSPHLYQFIISSCFSSAAITTYKIPSTLYTKTWVPETNSRDLHDFLFSDEWSWLNNRQDPITWDGLTCSPTKQGNAVMLNEQGQPVAGANGNLDWNTCARLVFNSNEGFVCMPTKYGLDIVSLKTNKITSGVSFENTTADILNCTIRLREAKNGSICRRMKKDDFLYSVIEASTGLPLANPQFTNYTDCQDYLENSQEI